MTKLTLLSHYLCPFVQRAVISLLEKGVPFERIDIDLANKPEWFLKLSPTGKTPVLNVGADQPIFESSVILEYLEETQPQPLHPVDPMERARHRSWIEFASSILGDIAGFYAAKDQVLFESKTNSLRDKFVRLEDQLDEGPYFAGSQFSLVDAAYGTVFRYFDSFDRIDDFGILADLPKLAQWRQVLTDRPSVKAAVSDDYNALLWAFLLKRESWLSGLMNSQEKQIAV